MDEVVVIVKVEKGKVQNEMVIISVCFFNFEEVICFLGGCNDVACLVGSFVGVVVVDDSCNDIVIWGNLFMGVFWCFNGIFIFNFNYFFMLGIIGGLVSVLNFNLFKIFDFLILVFLVEYGNVFGGVFDVGFCNGNWDEYEYMFQMVVFSGLEVMVEGLLFKVRNSFYLVSYCYLFVGLVD